jgi:hypothetical protein
VLGALEGHVGKHEGGRVGPGARRMRALGAALETA